MKSKMKSEKSKIHPDFSEFRNFAFYNFNLLTKQPNHIFFVRSSLLRLYLCFMKIRKAKIADVQAIHSLITSYAEREQMLFRSLADIYENLQTFTVVELDGNVIGCCALDVIFSDLAEIKSLAVDSQNTTKGIGKMLVEAAIQQACELGLARVFALTLNPEFFEKLEFQEIEKDALPMKVWKDCAKCPKQQNCDEIAVLKEILKDIGKNS